MKKPKRSFTLVELLVVIAILAILSTVGVVGYKAFYLKGLRTSDQTNADQWSIELKAYASANDLSLSELPGIDIRTYLVSTGKDTIPSHKNWTYGFNKSTLNIEVVDINVFATSTGTLNDLIEVTQGYYLLGQGSSEIEKAVTSLCYGDYVKLNNLNDDYTVYKNYVNSTYSKTNTIFLTPLAVIKDSSLVKVKNIFLQQGLYFLPNISSLNNFSYTEDYKIINKNIKFIIAGSEDLANKFNIKINGLVNLTNLSNSLTIKNKDDIDISSSSIVNYRFGVDGIYYYLEDVNDSTVKVAITYLDKTSVQGSILLDSEITSLKITCNIEGAIKNTTYSKVYTSASGASLYKMSTLFYNNETILGYKEIYYVV